MNEPGAPARSRIGIPSSRSISFLRLTASALMSAQKKQRLISTAITSHLNPESDSVKQASRHLEPAQVWTRTRDGLPGPNSERYEVLVGSDSQTPGKSTTFQTGPGYTSLIVSADRASRRPIIRKTSRDS